MIHTNLTKTDLISLGKGLGIALVGAGLTYLSTWVTQTDFGAWTPMIVAFWGVFANVVRKFIDQPVKEATGVSI